MSNEKDEVKLFHPNEKNTGPDAIPIPPTFVASGLANGDRIDGVGGRITNASDPSRYRDGRMVFFQRTTDSTDWKYKWGILFESVEAGIYNLQVFGLEDDIVIAEAGDLLNGIRVNVVRTAGAQVEFIYPPEDYEITGDEQQYFVPYGSCTEAVVEVTLGTQFADSIYYRLDINFWSAVFTDLNFGTYQSLRVVDAFDNTAPRNVHVI